MHSLVPASYNIPLIMITQEIYYASKKGDSELLKRLQHSSRVVLDHGWKSPVSVHILRCGLLITLSSCFETLLQTRNTLNHSKLVRTTMHLNLLLVEFRFDGCA